MNEVYSFCITAEDAGERIDAFLAKKNPDFTRSALQQLVLKEQVRCNGKIAKKSYKVACGDSIILEIPPLKEVAIVPQNIPLDIMYEDDSLLIINKPKGMVVHPAAGNLDGTLVNALLFHCGDSLSGINGEIRPGIVHRIDKDTSGLLVIAKNDKAHLSLSEQLAVHSITRVYHAVVYGNLKQDEGKIDAPIGRHPIDRKKMAVVANGKRAVTNYKVLQRYKGFTYVELRLETGRTHQIRVHMASLGHPLAGDIVYGPKNAITQLEGQCLHAKTLGFIHPKTQDYVLFDSDLPAYFKAFLHKISN
ncbi:MAG: RluA family pseudouridine synthase [Oscillospiraceae bacterium]|nr:RluA family pseudouridine synthase [Oscillospiraceae bacterium]